MAAERITPARRAELIAQEQGDTPKVTQPDPAQVRAIVEDRWRTITTDSQQFVEDGAGWSQVNSKAWTRLDDAIEYLAARMVGELRDRLSTDGDTSPVSELQAVVSEIHEHTEAAIRAWAEPIVAAELAERAKWQRNEGGES